MSRRVGAVGGLGSNQYRATPPGRGPVARSVTHAPVRAAVHWEDHDPDAVAWAFEPDRRQWEAAGFANWREVREWRHGGFSPAEAAVWRRHQIRAEDAVLWRDRIEAWPTPIGGARSAENMAACAESFQVKGLTFTATVDWDAAMPSLAAKAIRWASRRGMTPADLKAELDRIGPDPDAPFDSPTTRFERLTQDHVEATVSEPGE